MIQQVCKGVEPKICFLFFFVDVSDQLFAQGFKIVKVVLFEVKDVNHSAQVVAKGQATKQLLQLDYGSKGEGRTGRHQDSFLF